MKHNQMKISVLMILVVLCFCFSVNAQDDDTESKSKKVNLLVITGGPTLRHHIDLVPTSFYGLFMGVKDLSWTHATYDEAAFQSDKLNDFDVILFYNRSDSLTEKSKQNLTKFLESGKGLIVLHHSLGSYNDWEWWWKEVVGGKYQMKETDTTPKSDYKQGESIKMIPQKKHPITESVGEFYFEDETYKKLWISEKANILYKTDNPTSDGPTVWISPYKKSKVIVIQPGHAAPAHSNENYKKLIYRSILWASDK